MCTVTVITLIPQAPAQTLVKTLTSNADGDGSSTVTLGDVLTYTVTLTNTGNTTLTGVAVNDPMLTPNTISCPSVLPGGTCVLVGTYTVVQSDVNTGSITNVATADSPLCPAGGDGVCTVTVITPVVAPALMIVKTASASPWMVGVAASYTLTVTNTGTTATTAVSTITDVVPTGLTLGAMPTDCGKVGQTVTCTIAAGLATGAANAVSFIIPVTPTAAAQPSVTNTASVFGGGDPACVVAGDCESTVTTPLAGNVSIAKTLSGENGLVSGVAEPGENLTYTITLTNTGGVDVTGYALSDALPAYTSLVSTTDGGVLTTGVINWTGLAVPKQVGAVPGTKMVMVVVQVAAVIPDGVTSIANVAYETTSSPPDCPSLDSACVVTPTVSKISVTKALSGESITADGIAEPGEDLTYTITVRNDGGSAAINTIVNENVPLYTTYVSGAPTWTCNLGDAGGTPCTTLIDVPAHDGTQPGLVTLVFTVKVLDPLPVGVTSIANAVVLNDGTPPDCVALPTQAGCVVTTTGNVKLAKTVTSVTATGPSSYIVTYLIEVSNVGGSPQAYTLTDTLGFPTQGVLFNGNASVTTVGGILNPALTGGQFTPVNGTVVQLSDIGVSLASGAIHRYTVRVPVGVQPADLQAGFCTGVAGNGFYNQAAVSGLFDLESAACAPVNGDSALIHLVKRVTLGQDVNGNHYGDVGDVLNYSFTISNTGAVPLTTVQLFDPRVADLQCNPMTQFGAPIRVMHGDELFSHSFESVVIPGTLSPGDSVDCHATYVLTANDVARRQVVNSATTTASGPAGQAATSTATAIYTSFR